LKKKGKRWEILKGEKRASKIKVRPDTAEKKEENKESRRQKKSSIITKLPLSRGMGRLVGINTIIEVKKKKEKKPPGRIGKA
jgi:2,3-bisphosphoglycerate-independent phosphoglycerate mutase